METFQFGIRVCLRITAASPRSHYFLHRDLQKCAYRQERRALIYAINGALKGNFTSRHNY